MQIGMYCYNGLFLMLHWADIGQIDLLACILNTLISKNVFDQF